MDGHEPQPYNPEIERRAHPENEAELSLRAEHVIRHFLADNPKSELRKMVEEKLITFERAYNTLIQLARDPKTGVQRPDILPYVLQYEMMLGREKGQALRSDFMISMILRQLTPNWTTLARIVFSSKPPRSWPRASAIRMLFVWEARTSLVGAGRNL